MATPVAPHNIRFRGLVGYHAATGGDGCSLHPRARRTKRGRRSGFFVIFLTAAWNGRREEKERRTGYQSHGAGESAAAAGQPNPTPTAGPAVRLHSNSSPAQPSKRSPVKSRPIIPHTPLPTTNIELRRPLAIQKSNIIRHGCVPANSPRKGQREAASDPTPATSTDAHVHTGPTPRNERGAAQDADADADAV
ncbi:uncharacterized protein PAN0_020d5891 [Moesziomyces antarcticus]|uniref:Uncharacterized protein n=1 Tax=Pseudozyma antarctica TaxID=84753 RepID=A0A081CLW6_PSEA2|nr:uncharacterized protein PAN0_020d5891 [Moesziomyces antarcticus]GAK67662.1 hypothetical protein PAN0_020d5891 [Moesziomyces antarcticus]